MLEGVTAFSNTKMKPLTAKQLQRIEKKKKKLAAFLEIAKLNDKDREARAVMHRTREESESSEAGDNADASEPREEPSRKRHKKDNETLVIESSRNHIIEPPQPVPGSSVKSQELIQGVEQGVPCAQNLIPGFSESLTNANNTLPPGFTDTKKKQLKGEEFLELKRQLRERKNRLKCIPRFRLKDMGQNASIAAKEDLRTPLFLSDIQHVLMYSMLGHHSPYLPFRWCCLEKYNRISHTVVLVIDGFSLYDFQSQESSFSNITENFNAKVEVITPVAYNGNIIEELSAVPLTGTQKNKLMREYGTLEVAMMHRQDLFKVLRSIFPVIEEPWSAGTAQPVSDRFPRTLLLLSALQLIEENYPIPLKGEYRLRYADFVLTKDVYHEVTPNSPMFALDCEMCRTTIGELELTRVSIVNEQLEVVYESLVKPYNRITDYLTQYSGITKELLQNVTVRLEDVQRDLRALLPPDAILVGQSLNFDLMALKMMHPYVIDTSVIYNITGDRWRKTKLALLSQKFLGERIQQGNQGHCPIEDSSSSMKLVLLKLANDIEFGDAILCGRRVAAVRPLIQKPPEPPVPEIEPAVATSIFSNVTQLDKTAAIVGSEDVINDYSKYMSETLFANKEENEGNSRVVHYQETSNEMVVSRICDIAREHNFTLAHIQVDRTKSDRCTIKQVNKWCGLVWEQMAYSGLCVILFSGQRGGANGACFIQIKRPPPVNGRL